MAGHVRHPFATFPGSPDADGLLPQRRRAQRLRVILPDAKPSRDPMEKVIRVCQPSVQPADAPYAAQLER